MPVDILFEACSLCCVMDIQKSDSFTPCLVPCILSRVLIALCSVYCITGGVSVIKDFPQCDQ